MQIIDLSKYKTISSEGIGIQKRQNFEGLLHTEIKWFEKKFGAKEKESFYNELGLLLETGIDIKAAFDILLEDVQIKAHKKLLTRIVEEIIRGCSVYEALAIESKVFSKYELQSVQIGEETGRLPEVLKDLGSFYEAGIKLRRQIIGVLTYPAVVIGMAVLIVFFMLSFVVPVFAGIFAQSGHELPGITLLLISLSENSSMFLYWILFVSSLGYLLHKTQAQKVWYRKYSSSLLLKVPVLGKLIQKIYLARFCQSMKLLSSAKVRMNESLELVKDMIGYYPIESALEQVIKEVIEDGKLLNEGLLKFKIFPKKLAALIKLSEEVNEPEMIFEKLFKQYSLEIEHQQVVLGKLIEPLVIVILGLFVGFILVAMYLPMFEMSNGTF